MTGLGCGGQGELATDTGAARCTGGACGASHGDVRAVSTSGPHTCVVTSAGLIECLGDGEAPGPL